MTSACSRASVAGSNVRLPPMCSSTYDRINETQSINGQCVTPAQSTTPPLLITGVIKSSFQNVANPPDQPEIEPPFAARRQALTLTQQPWRNRHRNRSHGLSLSTSSSAAM
ncbi:hypothetical protein BCR44DRAFT_1013523 [Catenaria anguillulae PL171]|uniref:Uncharacterized protein n=1 Tax=Catenaria anguillulae PL171 TaxID=765915 RepID=A0A1Y2I4N6_9FUNG|nr:hypothetical protein BCR44DRAFT_1013523 [Catenaria anguillulae PL171]